MTNIQRRQRKLAIKYLRRIATGKLPSQLDTDGCNNCGLCQNLDLYVYNLTGHSLGILWLRIHTDISKWQHYSGHQHYPVSLDADTKSSWCAEEVYSNYNTPKYGAGKHAALRRDFAAFCVNQLRGY